MAFFNNAINGRGQLTTIYTSNDTWTMDHRTNFVQVLVYSGGNGGGSGRRGASTSSGGGGGGSAGSFLEFWGPASLFGPTETVTIGAGGTGGAVQTTNTTNGNPGSGGGESSFGNLFLSNKAPSGNLFGGGGTTTASSGGTGAIKGYISCGVGPSSTPTSIGVGNSGGGGGNAAGTSAQYIASSFTAVTDCYSYGVPGAGGGGSGADSVTIRTGGNGSGIRFINSSSYLIAVAAGGTEAGTIAGGTGTDGDFGVNGAYYGGSGGGGGGGQSAGASAGAGGDGGAWGGGGGGGGGSLNGTDSGKGGDGGDGAIVVVEYF